MFQLFFVLLEVIDYILVGIDLISIIADGISWIHGRPNRLARKQAKEFGVPSPKPDIWYWRVVVFTIIVIVISAILIYRHARQ